MKRWCASSLRPSLICHDGLLGLFGLVKTNFVWNRFKHVQPNGLLFVLKVVRLQKDLTCWISCCRMGSCSVRVHSTGSRQRWSKGQRLGSLAFIDLPLTQGCGGLVRTGSMTERRFRIRRLILVYMVQKVFESLDFLPCLNLLKSFAFLLRHLHSHFRQIWRAVLLLLPLQ